MNTRFHRLRVVSLLVVVLLCGCNSNDSDNVVGNNPGNNSAGSSTWTTYEREADYPAVSESQGTIPMRDGVELAYTLKVPADENGNPVEGPFPTVLSQTGYNIDVPIIPSSNDYIIKRGYAHVSVDVRGTGNSGGNWDAFGSEEQTDYGEVIDWVANQAFCDGNIGTWGASFMGITQLFTAAHDHPAHKAVFSIVPMADAYRDILYNGGQTSMSFVPAWTALVTGLTIVPTQRTFTDPGYSLPLLVNDFVHAITGFQAPILLETISGTGPASYDGEMWRIRSPIEYTDRIHKPTFIVGGLRDIFQRGEPLLYEAIKSNATTKLLIGPWDHVATSLDTGLPKDGVPTLDALAVQWFDQYLKGIDSGAEQIPDVTQYVFGAEKYVTSPDWPHPDVSADRWYLREGGVLSKEMPGPNETGTNVLQLPVNGLCSGSSVQWSAGVMAYVPLPCFTDNTLNEQTLEVTFTSEPMTEDYYINGPIQADIWISPDMAFDVGVSVRVTLVSPDGGSKEITNGILAARHRAVDPERSRYIDGEMVQPWHPFTEEAVMPAPGVGEPVLLNVEVFPTSMMVPQGYSVRLAIGASDFPHGMPPLTDLADQALGVYSLLTDEEHPSSVVFPVVPVNSLE